MPMRQKLKRRFGKDHQRAIVMKPKSDEWHDKYDAIDWKQNSKEANNEGRNVSNQSEHESSQA